MEHELIKALVWESYRQGVMTLTEVEHDLDKIEQNQMESIPTQPMKMDKAVLRVPKWRLN